MRRLGIGLERVLFIEAAPDRTALRSCSYCITNDYVNRWARPRESSTQGDVRSVRRAMQLGKAHVLGSLVDQLREHARGQCASREGLHPAHMTLLMPSYPRGRLRPDVPARRRQPGRSHNRGLDCHPVRPMAHCRKQPIPAQRHVSMSSWLGRLPVKDRAIMGYH